MSGIFVFFSSPSANSIIGRKGIIFGGVSAFNGSVTSVTIQFGVGGEIRTIKKNTTDSPKDGYTWAYDSSVYGLIPDSIRAGQSFQVIVTVDAEIVVGTDGEGSPITAPASGQASATYQLENVVPQLTVAPYQTPVGVKGTDLPYTRTFSGTFFEAKPDVYTVSTVQYRIGSGPLLAATTTIVSPGSGTWQTPPMSFQAGDTTIVFQATDNHGTVTSLQETIAVYRYVVPASEPDAKLTERGIPTTSSVTSWKRLNPRVDGADVALSSRARLFDPLWLLTRQWQVGEFQGEDAGTPVQARVRATTAPLSRIRHGEPGASGAAVAYDPMATPLEAEVERRSTRAADIAETRMLRLRVEAGLHFLHMLDAQPLSRSYRELFRGGAALPALTIGGQELGAGTFALSPLATETDGATDDETRRFVRAMAGRVPDADKYLPIFGGTDTELTNFLTLVGVAAGDTELVLRTIRSWMAWYDGAFPAQREAWNAPRLEYAASVAARLSTAAPDSVTLSADEFDGGRLEWSSFDVDDAFAIDTTGDAAFARLDARVIPAPVSVPGAPAARFWEMEDATLAYGAAPVGPTDVAHLLMIEYASTYGNDWYTVPLTTPIGTVTRVDSLVVTDTFGMRTLVRPIGDPALPPPHFAMWQQTPARRAGDPAGTPVRNLFFLPPTLARSIDGEIVEDVLFARDEMANVAWAIERSIEGGVGKPAQLGRDADVGPAETPNEVYATQRYLLSSSVPPNWIPLLPVRKLAADGATPLTRLQRGAVLQPDGSGLVHVAQSTVLSALGDALLFDEEVPREGARITRRRRLARWVDGSTWLWTAFRNDVGTGESSAGLRPDALQPTDGATLVSAEPPALFGPNPESFTVVLDGGSAVPYTAMVENPGKRRVNVTVRAWIAQGSTRRAATPALLVDFGAGPGVLPHGSWPITSVFQVLGAAEGTGVLAPGSATLELQLLQDATVLQTASVDLTLRSNAVIDAVTLDAGTAMIGSGSASFTASIENVGPTRTNVALQGWINQGTARRAAGGALVDCGSGFGVLPGGIFAVAGTLGASNTTDGTGTLVAGPATFELDLLENGSVLHQASTNIELVGGPPKIASASLASTSVMIDGVRPTLSYKLDNSGAPQSSVSLAFAFVQGATRRGASAPISVGSGSGVLPTGSSGGSLFVSAYNSLPGTGTLAPGAATLELQLLDATATVVDTWTIAVSLVAKPTIAAFTPGTTSFILNGPGVPFTATIDNPGPALSTISFTCTIVQGTVSQSTSTFGTLPTGRTTISSSMKAPSSTPSGTLVPGPATLKFTVNYNFFQTVASASVAITLTSA